MWGLTTHRGFECRQPWNGEGEFSHSLENRLAELELVWRKIATVYIGFPTSHFRCARASSRRFTVHYPLRSETDQWRHWLTCGLWSLTAVVSWSNRRQKWYVVPRDYESDSTIVGFVLKKIEGFCCAERYKFVLTMNSIKITHGCQNVRLKLLSCQC